MTFATRWFSSKNFMVIWMEFGVGELPSGFCNQTFVKFGKFLGIMVNIYSWVVVSMMFIE
jgi:hypothetical protein